MREIVPFGRGSAESPAPDRHDLPGEAHRVNASSTRRAPGSRVHGRVLAMLALVAILAAMLPVAALAGEVRGQLTIPSDYAAAVPRLSDAQQERARYWEEWNGFLDPRAERVDVAREIAVVLTGAGSAADDPPPYEIHNGSLWPSTIVASVGTQLRLVNRDAISYELFAEGNAEMEATQTAPEATRPITLTTAGSWPVRDRIYGHVRGHLHALPDLIARAVLTADGHFVFRGVSPGTYQLRAFHGDREIIEAQEVTVTDAPLTIPAVAVTASATR